ncbi:VCBS repeat-containing protein [Maribacter chungangensis]|uniref:VCBS repeat-containing protein n=1 Tax=Maribacter chungangensis TaxID=1069117 RepID=A0ABW3B652_9FLAO
MRIKILVFLLLVFLSPSCEKKEETLFVLKSGQTTNINFNNRIVETDTFNILTEEYIFNGGGVAIADFDNDDRNDILFTGNQVSNALYLNKGGFKFENVSAYSGIEAKEKWSTGVAIIDINLDGWLDVYICVAMGSTEEERRNMLFVNQGLDSKGIPTFKEMAKTYKIDDDRNSMNATFFDYDNDGLLDLYVLNNEQVHDLSTNYRPSVNDGSAISNDRLYRNNGDGTFEDVTIRAGIIYEGFGLGLAVADLNSDGWPDIHVSNDYLTNDILYINNQDGTFRNEIGKYLKHQSKFSMGSDISDYDNDGFLDILTLDMLGETNHRMKTNIGNTNYVEYTLNERYDYQYQYMRNMLHKGRGAAGNYSEIGLLAGISKTDWSWSPLFMDVDNDGYRDLFITNGFPRDITDKDFGDFAIGVNSFLSPAKILDSIPEVKVNNYAYMNKGDWTFEEETQNWGLDIPSFSNGAAFADLDQDGDLDYIVNNINDEAFVYENTYGKNENEKNNFLRLALQGPNGNPLGIGTKIKINYGKDNIQYYEHYLTRGYMSSVEPIPHFGIGTHDSITEIKIQWPDGTYHLLENIKANQKLAIAYENGIKSDSSYTVRPITESAQKTYFTNVTEQLNLDIDLKDIDFIDFDLQRTLLHKLSQNGPCLAVGDLNGDSLEDVIIGSSYKYSPVLLFQNKDGSFERSTLFTNADKMQFEEEGIELFDIDNDGDLDMYLVSGSNQFKQGSENYRDRFYLNDGNGKFIEDPTRIPEINTSGAVVKAIDFNSDGFVDIFIGGRTPMGEYPLPEASFLLINQNGILKDVTDSYAPDLRSVGMLTDAVWADYNGDGQPDLIVVGELMPVTIFKNKQTSFEKVENTGLHNYSGWWESVDAADMDNDGDLDFILGNLGRNNLFQPTAERPVTVIAKDFDENGSIDPITFAFFKDKKGTLQSYPVNFWGDINKQSTLFRSKFNYYREYAKATENTLLSATELEDAFILRANYDRSSYAENLGNGSFKMHELPIEAQLSPLNSLILKDIDVDGNLDILGVGNDFGNETFIGRYDALNGIVLKGDGTGSFETIPNSKSGLLAPKDAKSIAVVKCATGGSYYFITQNKDKLLVFKD